MRRPPLRGSLRTSALLVVLAVVLSPLAFVVATYLLEVLARDRTRERTALTADRVAGFLATRGSAGLEDSAGLRAVAEPTAARRKQRVRLVGPDDSERQVIDELTGTSFLVWLGDLFYGPRRVPVLSGLDAKLGPLARRPEVVEARGPSGKASRCWHSVDGNLFICETAQAITLDGAGTWTVHVQGSSRHALQALYESRRQLFKLTLFVLGLGLLLSVWMGRRIVRPVEALREEVLDRARQAVPRADLDVGRGEVGDLAQAFNALLRALAERERSNERFLADLAHEFKNPVAAVRACAEQLGGGNAVPPERALKLAEVLHRSSVTLDSLVTQFLELARAEAGLPNEAREPVDLAALLKGLTSALRDDARYPDVSIRYEGPSEAACVTGVPSRLESALRNLLDNAASFAGDRGEVSARLRRAADAVEIDITDTGPGIAPEHLPRLFERFFTTRGDRHGTGLGLALTRAVVEAHGGSLQAESPPEGGARFIVRLPFTSFSPPNH